MQDLQERIRRSLALSQSSVMRKSASDDASVGSVEKDPAGQKISSPEEGRTGAADDLITDSNGAPGVDTPGTHSEVTEPVGSVGDGGISGSIVEGNRDGEAEAILDPKKTEVTKDDVELITKAASAVIQQANHLVSMIEEGDIVINKFASEQDDIRTLLWKRASAGDVDAQVLCDMIASFEYGMAKKASDLEELASYTNAQSPEEVAELEDALNAAAVEDPEGALDDTDVGGYEDYAGEEEDYEDEPASEDELAEDELAEDELVEDELSEDELAALEEELSADTENIAQEAVIDLAELILEENPEMAEEEALLIAQDQVADAAQAIEAEQLLGDVDENGEYAIDDEAAGEVLDSMAKTASAYPLRGILADHLNAQFGLSPEQFNARFGL